jgi:spore coat polysaccharide biosynthesis protein SpsF (cytidylyltransferase family)
MKRVAIVQARMTSSRLPGKVLADLAGRPLLEQLLRRVAAMREVDEIVVATTALPSDEPVAELVGRLGFGVFRGDEQDVLSRFIGAARQARADLVVRLTADCPLLDPAESDRVVRVLLEAGEADYASNVDPRTYPLGLDTEALFRDTLERVGRLGRSPDAREHVTWLIHRERPELFLRRSVTDREDNSDLRWTVDTPDDLAAVGRLYRELALGERPLPYREVVAYARAHPEIGRLNAHVAQRHA